MLSYRHSFHAGNFADVHKHIVLTALIELLKRKNKAFCYIDTHSGAGVYNLGDATAMKNQEFKDGILRIINAPQPAHALINTYLQTVLSINNKQDVSHYPGSPSFAALLMREYDRLVLTELHSSEYPILKQNFKHDKRVAVHNQNGYQSLKAFIPPKEKRGLVLIDPSYELNDEYERVAKEVISAYAKWPTGCYAIWYPILLREQINALEKTFKASGINNILVSELCIHSDDVPKRLNGSGMLMINPPWQLDTMLKELQPWLLEQLRQDAAGLQRVEWLTQAT